MSYNPLPAVDTPLPEGPPELAFGLIADVQYADCPDGQAFSGKKRYFRHALEGLKMAVDAWNQTEISFIAQVGDLIDGRNRGAGATDTALATVMSVLDGAKCKQVHHLIGNHECYNFPREQFGAVFGCPDQVYYSFVPADGWRFVVLDPYDLSTIARATDDPRCIAAWETLDRNNPNNCRINDGSVDWKQGLEGTGKRWLPYNGALGAEQLGWLQGELAEAAERAEKVIVLSHVPVGPGSSDECCLLWNYEEVLAVLHKHNNVVAVLTGHDHDGGYCRDEAGCHHVTFKSPMEAPPPQGCHALVQLHASCICVHGYGDQSSLVLPLDAP